MNIIAPPLQTAPGFDVAPGGSITLTAQVAPEYGVLSGTTAPVGTLAPTGTVTICLTQNYNVGGNVCPSPTYSQTVSLTSPSGIYSQYSTATVTFPGTRCRLVHAGIPIQRRRQLGTLRPFLYHVHYG